MSPLVTFTTNFLNSLIDNFSLFWSGIDLSKHPYYYLDILIVAVVFYYIYVLIRGTRAVPIITGVVILAGVSFLSNKFELSALSWLLGHAMTILIIAIPVVLRDEFRKVLERIGQTRLFRSKQSPAGLKNIIKVVSDAARHFADNKIGATIVIARDVNLTEYYETGVEINAELSFPLLLNIFFPNSPLHDGAVIIENSKIKSASCVLPLAIKETDFKFGTRHKSALGLSEQSDALVVVVSEEKGHISLAKEGELTLNLSPARLQSLLTEILLPHTTRRKKKIRKRR